MGDGAYEALEPLTLSRAFMVAVKRALEFTDESQGDSMDILNYNF